jgi:hypothetical protein
MSKIFHPLLALIASATDKELAKYVVYLKHKNTLLRVRLPKHVDTSHEERPCCSNSAKSAAISQSRGFHDLLEIEGLQHLFRSVAQNSITATGE